MKKKILAIFLTFVLATHMVACFAQENDAWKDNTGTINLDSLKVSGDGISVSGNVITITKGGDFEVTGTLKDGMIYVKSDEKVKLRLSGMSLTNLSGPAIFFDNADKGFITITENTENYLEDGKEYTVEEADAVLFSNDDLEIKGDGTLTITGNYRHGIAGDDDVSIENGTIIINSYEHGIKVNDTLSVLGGDITVTTKTGKGMKADLEVIIDDGNINVTSLKSEGIESKGTLTVNGGNINITAYDDGFNTGNPDTDEDLNTMMPNGGGREMRGEPPVAPPDGSTNNGVNKNNKTAEAPDSNTMPPEFGGRRPEAPQGERAEFNPEEMPPINPGERPDFTPPEMPKGENPMQGGNRGGFGIVDEETALAHALTINGGTIYINAKGDGIDSNGNLTINGGTIIVDGPTNAGNGPLDSDGTMSINGGTVILTSSMGMVQLPRNSEGQNILSVTFDGKQGEGTEIVVKETESGEKIASHTSVKEFQVFVLSSDKIATGTEYTVYKNGEEYKTVTAVQGTTSAGSENMIGGGRGDFGGNRQNRENLDNSQVKVTVDGKNIRFDTNPVIKEDTTLVGFRAILEALGATVEWNEETRTVTAEKDGTCIELKIGSKEATVNGKKKNLLLAPEIINNSTMIPVRFVSEELNMNVDWNEELNLITVTSKR